MNKAEESKVLIEAILEGIHRIKGKEIKHVDLKVSATQNVDILLFATEPPSTHADSIAHSVEQTVKEITGQDVWHRDGYRNAIWILLDYGDVMVHVFQEDARRFYNLEELWADAKITKIEED